MNKESEEGVAPESESNEMKFKKELTSLINKYSIENGSDTSGFIIAAYLCECLVTYQKTVYSRDKWFGVDMWESFHKKEK